MADFLTAYKKTMKVEGGWANHPKDRGGMTWKGIARNFHPNWKGWPIIDQLMKEVGFPTSLKKDPGLQDLVHAFYKSEFWDRMKGDKILDQHVANDLFDSCVNVGVASGIILAQTAAFGLTGSGKEKMKQAIAIGLIYGKMDSKTLNKLNNK